MVQPNWYYNLQSGEPESPLGFVLQRLLESRAHLGCPSHTSADEEINVYLGHLLLAVMTPAYRERCSRYVGDSDTDVFHRVEDVRESSEKFCVYRANADHRLLNASVFRAPDAPSADETGSTYYHFAAEYHKQMYRRATPVSVVLEQLSDEFHTYEAVLIHMRHAYLQLWGGVSDAALQHWLRTLDEPPAAGTSPPDNVAT